jgi:hypothetical protein
MKCYFLDGIESAEKGRAALERLLPGGVTRILKHDSGDSMAYFDMVASDGEPGLQAPYIRASLSGRHFACDAEVLFVLETLRSEIGGTIKDDR